MKKVIVPLAMGFEEIEAVSIIDVLRRADIHVESTSVTGKISVTGSHQITLVADSLIEDVDSGEVEMVVLPGGMPGSKNLNEHEVLKEMILQTHNSGKPVGAICAAALVLGQMGLLNGKEATCYPGFEKYLTGAIPTGRPVVVSGNIVTGKGAGVAIGFALKVVELLKGKPTADALSVKLVADN